ncbi:hypothetical protein ASZ90_017211 [hydrocarbon metagenome]|uniref:Uncharacterized protein n=1 Tax=hydrocarbon metagenome TaxID=938273 RepID=A0A0W8E9X2_9ZZZZ
MTFRGVETNLYGKSGNKVCYNITNLIRSDRKMNDDPDMSGSKVLLNFTCKAKNRLKISFNIRP